MHISSFSVLARRTILFILLALSTLTPATAQVTAPQPKLSSVVISGTSAMLVHGVGFTKGGEVFIAVLDPWGEESYETRWTNASIPIIDMLGNENPGLGFPEGGEVVEVFEHLCGKQVMVRAYDRATRTWSNTVDIDGVC